MEHRHISVQRCKMQGRKHQHVHSEHGYRNVLTPSSRWVRVGPRRSDQPCKTLGGPSMHQMEILRSPVSFMSCVQTFSPRSLCVRIVSSRRGRVRMTSRNGRRVLALVALSSIQVIDWRFLHKASAARVSLVI